ncbi:MAG: hypothetical protein SGI77_02605 [Pirellulaceae bacterium]|nr:hypothetical protein [Pirellulaceae bacterium]
MIDTSHQYDYLNNQRPSNWSPLFAFAVGGFAMFLFVYIGVARPASDELSLLRQQIKGLDKSISAVAGQRDAVDETNHLLSLLSQQQTNANAARKTLLDLRDLNSTLLAESSRVREAIIASNELISLRDALLTNPGRTDEAVNAFKASEQIKTRLAESAETNEVALNASLDLLAIRDELLDNMNRNDQAKSSLENLVQLSSSLREQDMSIHIANDRVSSLIALKDSVLSQTDNLRDSIETLEITEELGQKFRHAANSFRAIRDWMIDIVALEPTFAQARLVLEPISEMVNLKRMDPKQLRDFARAFVQQSQNRIASNPNATVSHRSQAESNNSGLEETSESIVE